MISLSRIKERKLVQWALAYLAGAWLVLQVLDLMVDNFGWPAGIFRIASTVLAIGLLAALVIAWYHGEKGAQRVTGMEIGMLAGILVLAAVGVALLRGGADGATGDSAATVAGIEAAAPAAAEQGSIAVLPFADMSEGSDQEYFSDGLTEELLNVLARIPELRVAARTSSFAFKGKQIPVDSIGRALHVAHVLEGSVRTAGDMVRITAQLVNAETGYHLWSETYTREMKDIFAVQDSISRAIVAELELRLANDSELAQKETDDPEAHRLLLRAAHNVTSVRTRASIAEAAQLAEQAIERDPDYARAYAILAAAQQYQAYRKWLEPEPTYDASRRNAQRALELNPELAEAHVTLGQIADNHDWKFKEAEAHFRSAVKINPSNAGAHSTRAWLLMRLGRTNEALSAARRAVDLDRLSASSRNALASMQVYAGDAPGSIATYREALELVDSTASGVIQSNLALSYSETGQHEEAMRIAREAAETLGEDAFGLGTIGIVYARAKRRAEAEAALRRLEKLDGTEYFRASVYHVLGDRDRALSLLEEAVGNHDDSVVDLGLDPTFAGLHGDPRFKALLRKIGLPSA